MVITSVTDAHKERDVVVADIPGAIMHTNMDGEVVHMRIAGKMSKRLVEIDPAFYSPDVAKEKGELVLYVELLKALYGTL